MARRSRLSILKAADEWLSTWRHWVQGAYEADGRNCAVGACKRFGGETVAKNAAVDLLDSVARELYGETIVSVNDRGSRPSAYRKMRRCFREAIARAGG